MAFLWTLTNAGISIGSEARGYVSRRMSKYICRLFVFYRAPCQLKNEETCAEGISKAGLVLLETADPLQGARKHYNNAVRYITLLL